MFRLFIAMALALGVPGAALAQQAGADPWTRSGGRITLAAARISFPDRAGATRFDRAMEFSRQGEGLDNGVQYISRDRQVFATVYIYYPGLAHAGLTAFATDEAIRFQSGAGLSGGEARVVAAGGRDGTAIRFDYRGFRPERLASSAAFIKAGRWIVKLRVSGSAGRARDVEETMTALLAEMRFEGEIQPRPAAPLAVGACAAGAETPARVLPDTNEHVVADSMIGMFDGAGAEGRREAGGTAVLPPRFASRWCLSSRARVGTSVYPILRAGERGEGEGGIDGRSVAVAVISDSGSVLELVEFRERHLLLHHQIGQTALLGSYAGVPTDEQIAAILSGADRDGGRFRATVRLRPDGNSDIQLQLPEQAATPTT